jgi:putative IMPACT (imprinted ancient) family translation regulator
MALEAGGVSVFERYIEYETNCSYSDYQKIQVILSSADTIIDSTDFGSEILIRFAVAEDKAEKLKNNITESFAARVNLKQIGERFDTK